MDANPATAHMFIIKPFSISGMLSLFSTHPPTEQRIAALTGGRRSESRTRRPFLPPAPSSPPRGRGEFRFEASVIHAVLTDESRSQQRFKERF